MATKDVKKKTPGITKAANIYLLILLSMVFIRGCFSTNVSAGHIGVRQNSFAGIHEVDLSPGLHWEVMGMHEIYELPSHYKFLEYTGNQALSVRTKDNNTVTVDVSVPYRIIPGSAWKIAKKGNHIEDGAGGFRFERFAKQSADDVLRAHLADLSSTDFYETSRRLEVADEALASLNEKLAQYHLEANAVLLRAIYFRPEFEQQLARIQFNEQSKLLDGAKQKVAVKQQLLDNYQQGTVAGVAAKEQEYAKTLADLERAYQVGLLDVEGDRAPGAARRLLKAVTPEDRVGLLDEAAVALAKPKEEVSDDHLLGIQNISAETVEYDRRVRAEADGVSARLLAEAGAEIAAVQGAYEARLNQLLGSPAGRAYVAYEAAANVKFADTLTFRSSDGIPSVYRLRRFAEAFMGR
jgi:regulator of protease activity HflC (stomatin/prohibitin superfamily)